MTDPAPRVEVLGIRHHGPGSARAVRGALDLLQPEMVLIEGPADADPLAGFATNPGLQPPVALLAYATDAPSVSAFWPFAVFSPEWQALRWAAEHEVPVRFCDLPTGAVLADLRAEPTEPTEAAEATGPTGDQLRRDPLAALATAAGYTDPERWWDDVVEARLHAPTPFGVIAEAMTELRSAAALLPPAEQRREDRREAYMRQTLRAAMRAGAGRIAVVCGAWHAPALAGKLPPAASDTRLLRGLPRRATAVTWVPWTSSRLSYASGYGAGITSPGWYHHLFTSPDDVVARWLIKVATVLRAEDLPISSAHVIEAVRLAEALAAMRGRPLAGLEEVTEATRAVLCDGDDVTLALVTGRLVVGESLGGVPDTVPTVPLESDLRAAARRLRLKQEALRRSLDLDLRKENDLARSRLLHRLTLLGVDWGEPDAGRARSTGTFRESWSLTWRPELAVAIIEASMWGTTVAGAAAAKAVSTSGAATLPELTALVERCLLADLPSALAALLIALDARAAQDLDVLHLMDALPSLIRAHRYTDVRATDTAELARIADALLVRICAALPAAVTGLDDDAARALRGALDAVHAAVLLREEPAGMELWLRAVHALAGRDDISGVLAGRAMRLLRDGGHLGTADALLRLGRSLSVGTPAPTKAAWIEGFLEGGGLLLARDADLLGLLDRWVTSLPERDFTDVLPLLRRMFGGFLAPERRAIGEAARRRPSTGDGAASVAEADFDETLAMPALATVAAILGVPR